MPPNFFLRTSARCDQFRGGATDLSHDCLLLGRGQESFGLRFEPWLRRWTLLLPRVNDSGIPEAHIGQLTLFSGALEKIKHSSLLVTFRQCTVDDTFGS